MTSSTSQRGARDLTSPQRRSGHRTSRASEAVVCLSIAAVLQVVTGSVVAAECATTGADVLELLSQLLASDGGITTLVV